MASTTHTSNGHARDELAALDDDQLVALAKIPEPPRVLYHASELNQLPPSEQLIPGFLETNKITQMFGQPGQGKSLLNLDMALCVAQFVPVVYVAAEAPEEYYERIQAWCTHNRMTPGQLYVYTQPVNFMNVGEVDTFYNLINPIAPRLITIDPLQACAVGGNLSDERDMMIVTNNLNRLRAATEAAILVCHHAGWADDHERGSSVLRGVCRLVMKAKNNGDGLLTLSCEKNNTGKPFEKRLFNFVPVGNSVVLVPTSRMSSRDWTITEKQLDVLEALTLAQYRNGAAFKEITEHLGIAKSTLNGCISALIQHGCIEYEGHGMAKRYKISEAGHDQLLANSDHSTAGMSYTRADGTEQRLNWQIEPSIMRGKNVR